MLNSYNDIFIENSINFDQHREDINQLKQNSILNIPSITKIDIEQFWKPISPSKNLFK